MGCGTRSRCLVTGTAVVAGALGALAGAARALAADCSIAPVVVEGAEPARTTLADALTRAGVHTEPAPGCAAEKVVVRSQGARFELTITDPYGRVSRRSVADLQAASAVVEATPGSDFLVPLLPEAEPVAPVAAVPPGGAGEDDAPAPSPDPVRPVAVASETPAPDHARGRGLSLMVATEAATGSDRSSWAGLAISGCVTLGPTCVGTRVHFWRDLDAEGESGNAIGQRATGAIALSLDVPFTRHHIDVRPGVELGLGWIHMGRFTVHPADDSDFDQGEVLAGVHLGAAYPVSKRWAVEAGLGASLSLFAHRAPFTVQGVQLPGEPFAFVVATLGMRYGSP